MCQFTSQFSCKQMLDRNNELAAIPCTTKEAYHKSTERLEYVIGDPCFLPTLCLYALPNILKYAYYNHESCFPV